MKFTHVFNLIKIFVQDVCSTKSFQIYFSSPSSEYRSIGFDYDQYYDFGFMSLNLYYINVILTNDRAEHQFDNFYPIQEALFNIIKMDPYLHLLSPDLITRHIATQIVKNPTASFDDLAGALWKELK
jgi:hypothetical protein